MLMRNAIVLVAGMVLLVLGAQGGIRLVANHDNAGVLAWLPGGFTPQLVGYLVIVAAGLALASWGRQQSDRAEDNG